MRKIRISIIAIALVSTVSVSRGTSLVGNYHPDGTVDWSGEFALTLARDYRTSFEISPDSGIYGVDGWAYYEMYYNRVDSGDPNNFNSPFQNILFGISTEVLLPWFEDGYGQMDNGWDVWGVFGGISGIDNKTYASPIIPTIPSTIVLSGDQLQWIFPSRVTLTNDPTYPTASFADALGNRVTFRSVPDGGSTALMLVGGLLGLAGVRRHLRAV